MSFTQTHAEVHRLATAIHDYRDRELPKRHPRYPLVDPDTDDGPPPPEQEQLRELIEGLSDFEAYKVFLVMTYGQRR